jgi:hypothetical protein
MGRALTAVGALLVLCFLGFGLVIYANREPDRVAIDNLLAENLTRAVALAQGRGEDVSLAELTDFPWDRVYIVRVGTPVSRIDRALGFDFNGDFNYTAESSELLIFVRHDKLARFADYRARGRWVGLPRPIAVLTPDQAMFRVRDLVVRPVRPLPPTSAA